MAGLDWADWRRLALGLLGWTPEAFWQATPDDLVAALEGLRGRFASGHEAALRRDLTHLDRTFGDR
ncbi:phage tail assembly chaperone [Zavarzinia sp. CC-PAN008]|uniref:phage tail assembly chaperone n=1 Tax=Zavarzinia sp. CC-PAN008 TaxID=3243332 RepID=UPI003F7432AE